MIDGAGQWLLGLLAGGTILLGLPIARLRRASPRTRAFLNAISTGVLIFLLVEMSGHLLEGIEELVEDAAQRGGSLLPVWRDGGLFALGFALGLLGMVLFERRFLGAAKDGLPPGTRAKYVALMIAVGLGLHNFSEGLAIGQGYAAGAMRLAWLLAIGFALHNATEGFGIAAPLSGHQVSWAFLVGAGLIAGGPTLLGAIVGGWGASRTAELLCLALASGTILYLIGELLHLGRQLKEDSVVGVGLLAGFFLAVATDFTLVGAVKQNEALLARARAGREPIYYVEEVGEHAARRGGWFGDADDLYHYELVLDGSDRVRLYVSDARNRPLNVRLLEGRWTLDPDGGALASGRFTPSIDGAYFTASLPRAVEAPVQLEVAVRKGAVWAPLEFTLIPPPHPQQVAAAAPLSP